METTQHLTVELQVSPIIFKGGTQALIPVGVCRTWWHNESDTSPLWASSPKHITQANQYWFIHLTNVPY